jgi:hypothetical protein
MDMNFTRIRYVRYADDFIISVIGPITLAKEIKERISIYLRDELKLTLNAGKTLITKASEGPARFLGAEIRWPMNVEKKVILNTKGKRTKITARISIRAPIKKLFAKLVERKFLKHSKTGDVIPTKLGSMTNLSHADIIKYYNAVTRGIVNYYSFADNRSSLGSVVRYLHMSCARTLALKYKLRQMAKAYKRFGKRLKCPETAIELYVPPTLARIRNFNVKQPATLEMMERSWASKLTLSNVGKTCIVCDSHNDVQMHHLCHPCILQRQDAR